MYQQDFLYRFAVSSVYTRTADSVPYENWFKEYPGFSVGSTTIRLRTFRLRHFVYRHFVYYRIPAYRTVIHPTSVSANHYFLQFQLLLTPFLHRFNFRRSIKWTLSISLSFGIICFFKIM